MSIGSWSTQYAEMLSNLLLHHPKHGFAPYTTLGCLQDNIQTLQFAMQTALLGHQPRPLLWNWACHLSTPANQTESYTHSYLLCLCLCWTQCLQCPPWLLSWATYDHPNPAEFPSFLSGILQFLTCNDEFLFAPKQTSALENFQEGYGRWGDLFAPELGQRKISRPSDTGRRERDALYAHKIFKTEHRYQYKISTFTHNLGLFFHLQIILMYNWKNSLCTLLNS